MRVWSKLGWTVLIVALFGAYWLLSLTVAKQSDDATAVLQAQAMLGGNWGLRGWILPPDTNFNDLLAYAAFGAFFGPVPGAMAVVPAVFYALVVAVAVRLASVPARAWSLGALATFVVLGLPQGLLRILSAQAPMHVSTLLLICTAFLWLDRERRTGRRGWLGWGLATGALTLAAVGDPLTDWVAFLPLILVAVWRSRHGSALWELRWGASALVAFASAELVRWILVRAGLTVIAFSPRFVTLGAIGKNFALLVDGLLQLFNAAFFGLPVLSVVTIASLVHLGALLAVVAVAARSVREFVKRPLAGDYLEQVLAIACVIDLASYLVSDLPVDILTSRYLLPVVVFGSVLLGRFLASSRVRKRWWVLAVAVLGGVSMIEFMGQYRLPQSAAEGAQLGSYLEAHHLHDGFGSYWVASVLTVNTGGAVRCRPIRVLGSRATGFPYLVDRNWFRSVAGRPARFVVVDDTDAGGLTVPAAIAAFGTPAASADVGGDDVLIWNHDLTGALH